MDGYQTLGPLGEGSSGTALLARHKVSGKKFVIKLIPLHTVTDRGGYDLAKKGGGEESIKACLRLVWR